MKGFEEGVRLVRQADNSEILSAPQISFLTFFHFFLVRLHSLFLKKTLCDFVVVYYVSIYINFT